MLKPCTQTITILLLWLFSNYSLAQTKVFEQIFFKSDSSTFSFEQQVKIKKMLSQLDTLNIDKVIITGFCDDLDTYQHNKLLSLNRANSMKNFIIKNSTLHEEIFEINGMGEIELPKIIENTDQQRQMNRRVDIQIEYTLKPKTEVPKEEPKLLEKQEYNMFDDLKVGDKITLENILFYGGKHLLLPESYDDLDSLTLTLIKKKNYHILILGHICCIHDGQDGVDIETGQRNLSLARARVIYNYLIAHGVSEKRLSYKGMKADYPTGKGDKYDRRVEIQITSIDEE